MIDPYVTTFDLDRHDDDSSLIPDFDDALRAVLDEVARLPLRSRDAFLLEQSDEIREAALACIAVRGGDCVDAADGMRDDFLALRRATRSDWRDPRLARKAG